MLLLGRRVVREFKLSEMGYGEQEASFEKRNSVLVGKLSVSNVKSINGER
jgi:hypothetical protein